MNMYIFARNILCIRCSMSSIFFVQSWRVERGAAVCDTKNVTPLDLL